MGKISSALKKQGTPSAITNETVQLDYESVTQEALIEREQKKTTKKVAKPSSPSQWDEKLSLALEDKNIAESFRMLRNKILHPVTNKDIRTILIASTEAQEGKSFIAANLGIALAGDVKQHALIVGCDLRRPSLANLFGYDKPLGLTEYLRDNEDLADLILQTGLQDLTLLPSGQPPSNPTELLTSEKMEKLIGELKERYDDRLIILDSPPALVAAETSVLAQQVDSIILVVRWGTPGRESIKKCVEMIGREKIMGIVFNAYEMNILDRRVQGIGYYNYFPQDAY